MTEEQTKTPVKRGPKRSYAEKQAELRASAEKELDRKRAKRDRIYDEWMVACEMVRKDEEALNAPIDPDMAGIVADVVGRTVVQPDQSQPVVHIGAGPKAG